MNDSAIDLNLMFAFEALYIERNVSRAAGRLGIGQPAMSNALARLRALFVDDLFLREGRVMVPTPRASEIAPLVNTALASIRDAVQRASSFEPATARRTFHVSGGDYALMSLLPGVMDRLRRDAPDVDLRFRFIEKGAVFDALDDGSIDLALGVYPTTPKRFESLTVFDERFVCLIRADHPVLASGLTPERYANLAHVLVTERGDQRGAIDDALQTLGLKRRIVLTVPSVLVVRRLLVDTDLVATVGERVGTTFAGDPRLMVCDPPLSMARWTMSLLRVRRRQQDAGLRWLAELILRVGRGLDS
jgi:DNA-binding transcriptional LysR family regulator